MLPENNSAHGDWVENRKFVLSKLEEINRRLDRNELTEAEHHATLLQKIAQLQTELLPTQTTVKFLVRRWVMAGTIAMSLVVIIVNALVKILLP